MALHPDLVQIGRLLRDQMDRTLDAEMEAARAAAARRRTLRDRLLEAEDRQTQVVVSTANGISHRGRPVGVGVDHVDLDCGSSEATVVISHIATIEFRS